MKYSMIPVCGLGNVVLSLVGFYHTLRNADIDPRRDAFFLDWRDKPYEEGVVFGGHPRPDKRDLHDIFPNIGYISAQKSLKDEDVALIRQFCNDEYLGNQLVNILSLEVTRKTRYAVIWSWFSHRFYRSRYRDEIIDWLEFGPVVRRGVNKFFNQQEIDPLTTISLHCRLGSPVDFIPPEKVSPDDYLKGLRYIKEVYPEMRAVLVCSENKTKFEEYLPVEKIENIGLKYVFYDANPEDCLYAMRECAHHVMSNSTLSFSIMYLDKKFPEKCLTVGTYQDYTHVQMVTEDMISRDRRTGLLHFKDI